MSGTTWPDLLKHLLSLRWFIPFLIGLVLGFLLGIIFKETKYYASLFVQDSDNENIEASLIDKKTSKLAPTVDLSGSWILENTITSAADSKYNGMKVTFKMYLDQENGKIEGKAVKFAVNTDTIPEPQRTEIILKKGEVHGNQIRLVYEENGKDGEFNWNYNQSQKIIEGTFKSKVAISRGRSYAFRRPN